MSFADNIHACAKCPGRQQGCAGACLCTVNGRPITANAEASECPLGRYVDSMGRPLPAGGGGVPEGYDPKHFARDSKGTEPCAC